MHDSSNTTVLISIPSMPIIEHSSNIAFGPLSKNILPDRVVCDQDILTLRELKADIRPPILLAGITTSKISIGFEKGNHLIGNACLMPRSWRVSYVKLQKLRMRRKWGILLIRHQVLWIPDTTLPRLVCAVLSSAGGSYNIS